MMDRMIEAAARTFDFRRRELVNNIQGFSELLADPTWPMREETRLEYAEIVFASTVALEGEEARFLSLMTQS